MLAAKREYQRAWERSDASYATLNYRYARLLLEDENPATAQRVLVQHSTVIPKTATLGSLLGGSH